jgi:HAD superfamily hydrolase (TIGR01509 family)
VAPDLRAVVWDVDGTVAETERDGHRVAFNQAFESIGLDWRWSVADYGPLLQVTGGRERLLHDMAARADAPPSAAERVALAQELHRRKNAFYAGLVQAGAIAARPGVQRLMDECSAAGVAMAIATTTSGSNVQALFTRLLGPAWRKRFGAVVCAEDAPVKKPDPQAYRLALQGLGLAPGQAFALEDSPAGLAAARAAGVRCGVTRSVYFAEGDFEGAEWVRGNLDDPAPMTLALLAGPASAKMQGPSDRSSPP